MSERQKEKTRKKHAGEEEEKEGTEKSEKVREKEFKRGEKE